MKNFFISFIVSILKIFSKRKNLFTNNPRILIITTTALGDSLWATPVIYAIKQKYPLSHLFVLTSSLGKEVFKNNPYIDEIFLLKKPYFLSFFSVFWKLKKLRIQKIFLLHASQRLVFPLSALINAETVISTKGLNKGLDHLFTKTLLKNPNNHEIERRVLLLSSEGILCADKRLHFYIEDESTKILEKIFEKENIDKNKKLILLHPGAKDSYKCWPKQCFEKLGKLLTETFSCEIILTGQTHEKKLIDSLKKTIFNSKSLVLPFQVFASCINKCDLLITNDTGPMHLACSLNKDVIAIFSPTNPAICGPYNYKKAKILYSPPTCSYCYKRKCNDPFCLLQISPYTVLEEAKKILS